MAAHMRLKNAFTEDEQYHEMAQFSFHLSSSITVMMVNVDFVAIPGVVRVKTRLVVAMQRVSFPVTTNKDR